MKKTGSMAALNPESGTKEKDKNTVL